MPLWGHKGCKRPPHDGMAFQAADATHAGDSLHCWGSVLLSSRVTAAALERVAFTAAGSRAHTWGAGCMAPLPDCALQRVAY